MRFINVLIWSILSLFIFVEPSYAAINNPEVANFTNTSLITLIAFASLATTFFLIKGGYLYMTSSGKPDTLDDAKKTIKNAVLGLVLILGAAVYMNLLNNAFTTPANTYTAQQISLSAIDPIKPQGGLTQVILDAVNGFFQSIVQSATKPLVDGILGFLASTPSVATNSVVFNFWLIMLGIVDSLFALAVALFGFQLMSARSLGFEEVEFSQILPRLGIAFLGANMSIFLADWVIGLSNTLVTAVLNSTGGLSQAWLVNVVDMSKILSGSEGEMFLITLIFMVLFIILCVILLLFYISRLIVIALGVAISPFIFLLWAIPKTADFAEISIKAFFVTVFTVFVHIVIIQLASAFLAIPGQTGTNSLLSILIAIGLLFTLLKTPGFMMQLIFYNTGKTAMRKVGSQIMNVLTTNNSNTNDSSRSLEPRAESRGQQIIKSRRYVKA
jgi:hypothetical protein